MSAASKPLEHFYLAADPIDGAELDPPVQLQLQTQKPKFNRSRNYGKSLIKRHAKGGGE